MGNNKTTTSISNHLSFRREALLKRMQARKMTSFRLPKETTAQLLHYHSNDAVSDDDEPEHDHDHAHDANANRHSFTAELPVNRRRRSLQRIKKNMTSFRLPKDKTHQLLAAGHHYSLDKEEEEEEDEHEEEATTVTGASTTASASTSTSTATCKKSRRCSSLKMHKKNMKMTSFRLPKEATKPLLHLSWNELEDSSAHGGGAKQQRKTGSDKARPMPRQLVRQSSFNARTA